jgi:hypothetical protein
MKRIFGAFAALLLTAQAGFAACTTDTPVSLFGYNGSNGLLATDGSPPANFGDVLTNGSAVGQIYNGGDYEKGVAHLKGNTECDYSDLKRELEDATNDAAALAAALSTPIWLEAGEKFAISGGLGFADNSTALGATALVRIDRNVSGFFGGAVSTEGENTWAGKAGLRVGW